MQLHDELNPQSSEAGTATSAHRKRRSSMTRRVTVQLTEELCERLDAATERPGVGKSMVVDAALERFLTPGPSVEELVQERFDNINIRFDRLDRDIRIMAETIALHARYHLAVMPPLPQPQQRHAAVLGDERFKVLAGQVDQRVRHRRPLMQETIDRLNVIDQGGCERAEAEEKTRGPDTVHNCAAPVVFDEHDGDSRGQHCAEDGTDLREAPAYATQGPQPAPSGSIPEFAVDTETSRKGLLSNARLIFSVFLPFATGYFLSFFFRTVNASISPALGAEFGLDAAKTGLLASVYFLVFAGAQLPIGVLLDRYGPRRVHSVLLVLAGGGATLFGNATGFAELLVGRAMIGLGVAAALMSGLKAVVTWFPRERIAFVNGCMIMVGSLGAVAATAPTDWLLNMIGWRGLFEALTFATFATAGIIYLVVPDRRMKPKPVRASGKPLTLRSIFSDSRFLRIAPLSAACIGSSWAMQSLWAASWLADVEGLDRQSLINQLFAMALGISLGALLLGTMADRLRRRGISTEVLFVAVAAIFILAELALVLRVPIPSVFPWSIVPVAGAASVLSYAMIADYFPQEVAARANGALNLLHFGWAFIVQYGTGVIVGHWTPADGHYPLLAYQTAFGLSLALQTIALVWFAIPWLRSCRKYPALRALWNNPEQDSEAGYVVVPAQGPLVEVHEPVDW